MNPITKSELHKMDWSKFVSQWIYVYDSKLTRTFYSEDTDKNDIPKDAQYAGRFYVDQSGNPILETLKQEPPRMMIRYQGRPLAGGELFLFWTFVIVVGTCLWGTIFVIVRTLYDKFAN